MAMCSWTRRLPRKLSSTTLLITLLVVIVLVWMTGFHGFVCTSSLYVNLKEIQERVTQGFVARELSGAPVAKNSDVAQTGCCPPFDTGISFNDMIVKHNFRDNAVLFDDQLVQNSAYFIPRSTVVNPLMRDYLIDPKEICEGSDDAPYLIITIPSLSYHTSMRETIRNTWASVVHTPWPRTKNLFKVKIVFVFGKTNTPNEQLLLKNESKKYGDILYVDFVDSYRNLTYKSLTSLYWASTRCPKAKFFMKVDEDTFVNIPYLIQYLYYHQHRLKRAVLGYAIPKPVSVRSGKWAVSIEAYPLPVFPKYVFGHSYVISNNITYELANVSQYMPFIPVEDASVTGVLCHVIKANRLHNSMFATARRSSTCSVQQNVKLSVTMNSEDRHRRLWEAVTTGNCSYELLPKGKQ